jgi:hypothetical protein
MNSLSTLATKLLTLVPIALALYYFDLPGAHAVLSSPGLMAVMGASVAVFVFGVAMKRKIVKQSLELSEQSYPWGTLFLAAFVAVYVYGSYSAYSNVARYESLVLLVVAYLLYRVGTMVVKTIAPLALILMLSYPVALSGNEDYVLIYAGLTLLAFLVYAKVKPRTLLMPGAFVGLGLVAWFHPAFVVGSQTVFTWFLVPLPAAALVISRVRSFGLIPRVSSAPCSSAHEANGKGYCVLCGRRVGPPKTWEHFAPWGLITVVGVVALMLVGSVPVLALSNGVPSDSVYTVNGVTSTPVPVTPAGWEVNSTHLFQYNYSEPYAVENVYVPVYHPEVKNYTMYYEVATGTPISAAPSGGEIPGWGRLWNNFTFFGPFYGYLTAYQNPSGTMLTYSGTTTMTLFGPSGFQNYNVGVSFVREFKNFNAGNDSAQFIADISLLWLPAVSNSVYYSTWTAFLSSTESGANFTVPFLEVVFSSFLIAWAAYRARLSDMRLDDFVRRASRLSEGAWLATMRLLSLPRRTGTGFELVTGTNGPTTVIRELQDTRVIRERFVESGDGLILAWKAS